MADITPGIYRLKADTPAVHPDKRIRNDWRAAPMKAGTLFAVRDDGEVYFDDTDEISPTILRVSKLLGYAHLSVPLQRCPREFLDNLERERSYNATEYLSFIEQENSASRILDLLMAKGLLTTQGIDGLLKEIDELDKETDL